MQVVELRQQCQILAGSGEGVNANRSGYGAANIATWDSEE